MSDTINCHCLRCFCGGTTKLMDERDRLKAELANACATRSRMTALLISLKFDMDHAHPLIAYATANMRRRIEETLTGDPMREAQCPTP